MATCLNSTGFSAPAALCFSICIANAVVVDVSVAFMAIEPVDESRRGADFRRFQFIAMDGNGQWDLQSL